MGLFTWSKTKISQVIDPHGKGLTGSKRASLNERIDPNTPIEKAHYAVLDTELTGLDAKRDSIVSIGAVKMDGAKIELGNTFYSLVKPRCELKTSSIKIHGITPSDLSEKPRIEAVLPKLTRFLGDDIIVGYVPSLDMGFLNREMVKHYTLIIQNPVIDVLTIYRWMRQRMCGDCVEGNPSLYEIAKTFDIAVSGAHNAMSDAFITAQVLQRLIYALQSLGIETVGELLRINTPSRGGERFLFPVKISSL